MEFNVVFKPFWHSTHFFSAVYHLLIYILISKSHENNYQPDLWKLKMNLWRFATLEDKLNTIFSHFFFLLHVLLNTSDLSINKFFLLKIVATVTLNLKCLLVDRQASRPLSSGSTFCKSNSSWPACSHRAVNRRLIGPQIKRSVSHVGSRTVFSVKAWPISASHMSGGERAHLNNPAGNTAHTRRNTHLQANSEPLPTCQTGVRLNWICSFCREIKTERFMLT